MICNKHTYDETGHCFDCDAKRPTKAELMRETRRKHREAGLVKVEVWVKPDNKQAVLALDER